MRTVGPHVQIIVADVLSASIHHGLVTSVFARSISNQAPNSLPHFNFEQMDFINFGSKSSVIRLQRSSFIFLKTVRCDLLKP